MRKSALFAIAFVAITLFSAGGLADEAGVVGPVKIVNRGLDADLAAEIESYVKRKMEELHAPGIAISIVKGDELVYEGYFGWANIERKTAVSENTFFRVGSISKTFTAMGLMQQWEKERFTMKQEFNSCMTGPVVVPRKKGCPPVTFERMFTHTSGAGELMSFGQLLHPSSIAVLRAKGERKPMSYYYGRDKIKPGACPGEKWAYCNFCYGALGYALEELSGQSFEEYTRAHVFGPIGMKKTSFYENERIMDNLAQGYAYKPDKKSYKPVAFFKIPIPPMGNVFSTAPEMGNYIIALLNGGRNKYGKLVEPETLEFMYSPHYSLDSRIAGIGITFFINTDMLGTRALGHGGAVPGFGSQLYFAPDKKVGVIVLGNVMDKPPYEIAGGLIKRLIDYKPPKTSDEPDAELWPQLTGYYGSAHPDFLSDFRFLMATAGAIHVKIRQNKLIIGTLRRDRKKEFKLLRVSPDDPYFYFIDDPEHELPSFVLFERSAGGKVDGLISGFNRYKRLERAELAKIKMKALYRRPLLPSSF